MPSTTSYKRGDIVSRLVPVYLKAELQTERQRLQAYLDRTVYVHRVQFEKECAALSEIWKTIAELRSVFEALAQRGREAEHDAEYETRISSRPASSMRS